MSNNIKFYIKSAIYNLFALVLGGAVLQTFMIENGISEENSNFFMSAMYIVQLAVILVFSPRSDKIKNIIKTSAYLFFSAVPLVVALIATSFGVFSSSTMIFILLFIAGVIYNITIGIENILAYKLPYHIIDMKDYGRLMAVSGVYAGIVSFVFSVALSFFQNSLGYSMAMEYIFIATLIILIMYIKLCASFKRVNENVYVEKKEEKKINILKYKPFYTLIIPNLVRGFSAGIVSNSVSTGYYIGCLDSSSAATMVIIMNVVTILGCFLYTYINNKIKDRHIILITSILMCIFMPLMVVFNTTFTFLLFYALTYFVMIIINYEVPVVVAKIIDYEVAGRYNAGRMLLNTGGVSIAGFVCIAMIKGIGVVPTMIISGVMQLICGVGYYIYLKKEKKDL